MPRGACLLAADVDQPRTRNAAFCGPQWHRARPGHRRAANKPKCHPRTAGASRSAAEPSQHRRPASRTVSGRAKAAGYPRTPAEDRYQSSLEISASPSTRSPVALRCRLVDVSLCCPPVWFLLCGVSGVRRGQFPAGPGSVANCSAPLLPRVGPESDPAKPRRTGGRSREGGGIEHRECRLAVVPFPRSNFLVGDSSGVGRCRLQHRPSALCHCLATGPEVNSTRSEHPY